jgi:hypothetical protein
VWIFFFQQEILRLHSTPQMGHAVTAVKEFSGSSIEQVHAMSTIIQFIDMILCVESIV